MKVALRMRFLPQRRRCFSWGGSIGSIYRRLQTRLLAIKRTFFLQQYLNRRIADFILGVDNASVFKGLKRSLRNLCPFAVCDFI